MLSYNSNEIFFETVHRQNSLIQDQPGTLISNVLVLGKEMGFGGLLPTDAAETVRVGSKCCKCFIFYISYSPLLSLYVSNFFIMLCCDFYSQ